MSAEANAARKTVRMLSDRVDRETGHTMPFGREVGGFMWCFDTWQKIRDAGWSQPEQRAKLFEMQKLCMEHKILTADELAIVNTKYGAVPCPTSTPPHAN